MKETGGLSKPLPSLKKNKNKKLAKVKKRGMGVFSSSPRRLRLLVTGLDAVGKTTALYSLKLGKVVQTTPCIGSVLPRRDAPLGYAAE